MVQPTIGSTLTMPATVPTRAGFRFAGWSASTSGGSPVQPGAVIQPTATITWYAQWESTITYDPNAPAPGTATDSYTGAPPATTLATSSNAVTTLRGNTGSLARPGYTLGGWNTKADGTGTTYALGLTTYASTGDITLYAKWTPNSVTLTLSGNSTGLTGVSTGTTNTQARTAWVSGAINATTISITNYEISGWTTTQNNSGTIIPLVGPYTIFQNTTLYAVWKPKVYTLSYNVNGAIGSVSNQDWTYSAASSPTLDSGTSLVRKGYTFKGWSTTLNGSIVASNWKPTANTTLYAVWQANTYTLRFFGNQGNTVTHAYLSGICTFGVDNTKETCGSTSYTAGSNFTIYGGGVVVAPTGMTFHSWNTKRGGTGTSYAGGVVAQFYDNVDLYAQFKLLPPVAPTAKVIAEGNTEITVDAFPSAAASAGGATSSVTIEVRNASNVVMSPQPAMTCSPTTSNGVTGIRCMVAGLTNAATYYFYPVATNSAGTKQGSYVSAIPRAIPVTYNANSGSVTPSSANFNKGTPLILPTATRAKYELLGWFTASTGGTFVGGAGAQYSPTAAITLFAQWRGVAYNVTYNANGSTGTPPASDLWRFGDLGSGVQIAPAPAGMTRAGYNFVGWFNNAAGTGTAYAAGSFYKTEASIVLYAKWTAIPRIVTYHLSGGTGTIPASLSNRVIGDTFTVSAATGIVRSGYVFSGWNDGTTTYAVGSTYTVGATDVTLTAQWTPIVYTATYDLARGTVAARSAGIVQVDLPAGSTFTVAGGVIRPGFDFLGWSDGISSSLIQPNSTYTMPQSNVVFVAQWGPKPFTVTYKANGGSGSDFTATYYADGPSLAIASNPFTRAGYVFTRWNNAAADTGTATLMPGDGYATAAALTLYAQWAPGTYSVTYSLNGGTGGTIPNSTSYSTGNAGLTLPSSTDASKAGYIFDGWSTDPTATSGVLTGFTTTQNVTLYAVWKPVPYTATFTVKKGTAAPNGIVSSAQEVITLPSAAGYTDGDGQYALRAWTHAGAEFAPGAKFVMPQSDVVFAATYVRIYEVNWVLNGGSGKYTALQHADGETITVAAAPTRSGYTFLGWLSGGQLFQPSDTATVSSSIYVFSAQWDGIDNTITFDNGAGALSSTTYKTGSESALLLPLAPAVARPGYVFIGWSEGGITYSPGGTVRPTTSLTFTAIWQAQSYTIIYNANGGSGTLPASASYTTGLSATKAAAATGLSRTGFTFVAWNSAANGAGTTFAIDADLTPVANLTLFAQWSPTQYVVTYTDSATVTTSSAAFGSVITTSNPAPRPGFVFMGWDDGAKLSAAGSPYSIPNRNVNLVAIFEGEKFAVAYNTAGATSATPQSALQANASSFTLAAAPSKPGFDFLGWFNGTSTSNAGASYLMAATNVTFTAQWRISAPAAPLAPTLQPQDGAVTVTVARSLQGGEPTAYVVTAAPGGANCTILAPSTGCIISGLTNGTAYSFTTVASNATGTSVTSTSASTIPATLPDAPTGLSASNTKTTTSVTWAAPASDGGSPISGYTVTVFDSSNQSVGTCTTNGATTCAIPGLTYNETYTFQAVARNAVGPSTSSVASVPFTVVSAPDAPTIAAVTAGNTTATVSLNAPVDSGSSEVTSYRITAVDYQGNLTGQSCTVSAGTTPLSCEMTGLVNGSQYKFKAVAINNVGESAPGVSSLVQPSGPPTSPTNVTGTQGKGVIDVSWDAGSDGGSAISSYLVTASNGATCTVNAPAQTCQFTSSQLPTGWSYDFVVRATNAVGTSSDSLPSTGIAMVSAPGTPGIPTVVPGAKSATVSVVAPQTDNGALITSYVVTSSPGSKTCTVTVPANSCTVTGLSDGIAYTFVAQAVNSVGLSGASSPSAAVSPLGPPSVPTNVTATAGDGEATVSFAAPLSDGGSAITGFVVTAKPGNAQCTAQANETSCVVQGLTNGTKYSFEVAVINVLGESPKATTNTVTPTAPFAPVLLSTSAPTGRTNPGEKLSATAQFDAQPQAVVTYQWLLCTSPTDQTTCVDIAGATADQYTIQTSDLGSYIRVRSIATNSLGQFVDESSATALVAVPPVRIPRDPVRPVVVPPIVPPAVTQAVEVATAAAATWQQNVSKVSALVAAAKRAAKDAKQGTTSSAKVSEARSAAVVVAGLVRQSITELSLLTEAIVVAQDEGQRREIAGLLSAAISRQADIVKASADLSVAWRSMAAPAPREVQASSASRATRPAQGQSAPGSSAAAPAQPAKKLQLQVQPKATGSKSAQVAITNLKPGQRIKVTIKVNKGTR